MLDWELFTFNCTHISATAVVVQGQKIGSMLNYIKSLVMSFANPSLFIYFYASVLFQ